MKEKNIVFIITLLFLILGIASFYFSIIHSSFNFYKSEISVNNKVIQETLNYKPNKPYHTLYRNFQSSIFMLVSGSPEAQDNSIGIKSVTCSHGQAYLRLDNQYDSNCYNFPEKIQSKCLAYTENNEYGCSFGDIYGFKKDKEYKINAEYELYPKNIFKINNKYYIKFIAYSKNNHKLLIKNKNFILPKNAISKKYYFPQDDVIIYLPYEYKEGINTLNQEKFEFDTNYFKKILALLVCIIPALFFFLIWYFFGKENIEPDLPAEVSMYPNKRKAWEVAAYFNPPFSSMDKNFFGSLMLDLYKRKIIDLKIIEQKGMLSLKKELFVKINKFPNNLDKIEEEFIEILKRTFEICPEKYKQEGYLNIERVMNLQIVKTELKQKYEKLEDLIKDNRKKYITNSIEKITILGSVTLFMIFLLIGFSGAFFAILLQILVGAFIITFFYKNSLFIKFKENYYQEYKHWQAFKKYLSHSYTIKSATPKTIVIWEEYLLYATALGIPDKILKQGEKLGLVDDKKQAIYTSVYHSSALISISQHASASNGSGSISGGFSGAAIGGIGGGGGGGR
ncbi:MAG: DUF2207 family protein [Candidatus Nanoarchaeia archaeon]